MTAKSTEPVIPYQVNKYANNQPHYRYLDKKTDHALFTLPRVAPVTTVLQLNVAAPNYRNKPIENVVAGRSKGELDLTC